MVLPAVAAAGSGSLSTLHTLHAEAGAEVFPASWALAAAVLDSGRGRGPPRRHRLCGRPRPVRYATQPCSRGAAMTTLVMGWLP